MRSVMTAAEYGNTSKEDEMEVSIRKIVELRGGMVFHVRRSDRAPEMEHFPDIVIIHPAGNVVAFVELKSATRKVTNGQRMVLAMLQECNRVESFVCRPEPRDETEVSLDRLLGWINGGER